MGLLEGRGVVVTGAGRGLGRAFAIAVAREGAGVVVNDVDLAEAGQVVAEIGEAGGAAIASGLSVAGWDTAREIVESCVRSFGSIDGLVNNAVAYSFFGHPWDEDGDQIRRQLEVNVMGSLYCGAHAIKHMRDQRRGAIVNLTSNAMLGAPGMVTYAVTKGALASASYGWALELAPFNVRVNALAPGAMTRGNALAGAFGSPNKRNDPPEIVAPAVVYLLSDLSAGITGQIVLLNGGKLGLYRRAGVIEPVQERDAWTVEEIADTFDVVFREQLQPVGNRADTYLWQPDASE